jgi:pSer/pThr/pTyr-binding forkhead associated (FHA) protein
MLRKIKKLNIVVFHNGERKSYSLEQFPIVIGRSVKCDVPIKKAEVSRKHLILTEDEGELLLTDQGSGNGTFMGGERIPPNGTASFQEEVVELCKGEIKIFIEVEREDELEAAKRIAKEARKNPTKSTKEKFKIENPVEDKSLEHDVTGKTMLSEELTQQLAINQIKLNEQKDNLEIIAQKSTEKIEEFETQINSKIEEVSTIEEELLSKKKEIEGLEKAENEIEEKVDNQSIYLEEIGAKVKELQSEKEFLETEVLKLSKELENYKSVTEEQVLNEINIKKEQLLGELEEFKEKGIEKAERKAKEAAKDILREAESLKTDALDFKKRNEREAQDALEEAEDLREKTKKESRLRREELEDEKSEILKATKIERESILEFAHMQEQKIIERAKERERLTEEKLEQSIKNAELETEKIRRDGLDQVEEERGRLDHEIDKIQENSRAEIKKIKMDSEKHSDDLVRNAEIEAEEIIRNAYKAIKVLKSEKAESLKDLYFYTDKEKDPSKDNVYGVEAKSTFEEILDLKKQRMEALFDKERLILEKEKQKMKIEAQEEALQIKNDAQVESEKILRETFLNTKVMIREAEEQVAKESLDLEKLQIETVKKWEELDEVEKDFEHKSEEIKNEINDIREQRDHASEELTRIQIKLDEITELYYGQQKEFLEEKQTNEQKLLDIKIRYDETINSLTDEKRKINSEIEKLKDDIEQKELSLRSVSQKFHAEEDRYEDLLAKTESQQQDLDEIRTKLLDEREKLHEIKNQAEMIRVEISDLRWQTDEYVAKERKDAEEKKRWIDNEESQFGVRLQNLEEECHEKEEKSEEYAKRRRQEGDDYHKIRKEEIEEYVKNKQDELSHYEEKEEKRVRALLKDLKDKETFLEGSISKLENQRDALSLEKRNIEKEIEKERGKAKLVLAGERQDFLIKAKKEAQEIIDKGNVKFAQRNEEANKVIAEGDNYLEERKKEATVVYDEIIENGRREISEIQKQAYLKKKEILEDVSERKSLAEEHCQELTKESEKESLEIINAANNQANSIKEGLERERAKILESFQGLRNKETERNSILKDELAQTHQSKIAEFEDFTKQRNEALEKQLAEKRLIEEGNLKALKLKMMEAEKQRLKANVVNVTKNIASLVNTYYEKAGKETRFENMMPLKELKIIVKDAFDPEDSENKKALQKLVPRSAKLAEREKRFYQKLGAVAAAIVVIISTFIINPNVIDDVSNSIVKSVSSDKSSTERLIEKRNEELRNRPKLNPERDLVFRDNYVDLILYTSSYREIVEDAEFKKKWTVSLNTFLVDKLFLSEDIFVKVISVESKIHRAILDDLATMYEEQAEKNIARLREHETDNIQVLKGYLETESNWDKFWEYKEKYFTDEKNSRSLASPE